MTSALLSTKIASSRNKSQR